MKIIYISRFNKEYKKLPLRIKKLAEEKEEVFKKDCFAPVLNTHKLHGRLRGFWAFSIDYKYRIIFDFLGKNVARFYSVGNHDIYE